MSASAEETLKTRAERAQRAATVELYLQAFKCAEILFTYPENATEGQRLRFSHGLGRELWTVSNAIGMYGAAGFASHNRHISMPQLLQALLQEVEWRGLEIFIDIGKLDRKYLLQTYAPQWGFQDTLLVGKQWWNFPQNLYDAVDLPSWICCSSPSVDTADASTIPTEIYNLASTLSFQANSQLEVEKQLRKSVVQAMGGNVFIPEAEVDGGVEKSDGGNQTSKA
ncbi:hypothetical protein LXA43DRAFT_1064238 [Ganoderma leucocontextum]|nr:hypothetical protein LXA43DRAFT_1064238 [Ganoderma leucocontextum]